MPTPLEPKRSTTPEHGRDALERLYVYWLVSTLLLVLVLATIVVMTRGGLQRQAEVLADVRERLAALESRSLADGGPAAGSRAAPPAARVRPAQTPPSVEAAPPDTARSRPATGPAHKTPVETQGAAGAPPSAAEMEAALAAVLPRAIRPPVDWHDRRQAAELVQLAQQHLDRAAWDGATWEGLAVVARLLERHALSERLAARAAAEGASLGRYTETAGRVLLAAGRPRDALPFVEQFAEVSEGAASAVVLLASVLLATDDPAAADEVLSQSLPVDELDVADRLLAGRVYLAVERWAELERVLATLPEAPPDHAREHAFLSAVSLARQGRTVEALAILDGLLADQAAPGGASAPAGMEGASDTRAGQEFPDSYELAVWRGVTLMYARQTEAARQGLQAAAERDPGRAAAHYYLGVLEARAGRPELAETHLKNALASSARLAPAWEALAILRLERDELDSALEYLREALAANPRRASAQYLAALIYARRTQRDAARQALQAALLLDPAYLEEARQADALTALFTPAEMEDWARVSAAGQLPSTTEAMQGRAAPPSATAPSTMPALRGTGD